jgi:DNA-binding transcriptional ArsR family regulator
MPEGKWHSMSRRLPLVAVALTSVVISLALMLLTSLAVLAGDSSVLVTVLAEDTYGAEVAGARVTITQAENGTLAASGVTGANGTVQFDGLDPGMYDVRIESKGFANWSERVEVKRGTFGDKVEVTARLTLSGFGPQEPPAPGPLRWAIVAALVTLVSMVMYSKIRHDLLLDNAIRRRIFDHIRENPGAHYRAILIALDLPLGVLSYHLNRLEKAELVKSRQDGMYRRFFLAGRKTEVRFFLSDIQESILAVIRENQGISQSKIAERIAVSRKVVNYHVGILDQAGLIYMESRGRESACFTVVRPATVA